MNKKEILTELPPNEMQASRGFSRRNFLGLTGGLAAVGALLDSCNKDDKNNAGADVVLTQDDYGILNYAYALSQLKAAFYTKMMDVGFYANITTIEKALLTDIHDHEVTHREFFKALLGSMAIRSLDISFPMIDFTSRDSVLATAKNFEDLSVSAYNGVAEYITNPDYLVLVSKVVSVEARHAAYIRDLISNGTFASGDSQVDVNGMELSKHPSVVLAAASTYISTKIESKLP